MDRRAILLRIGILCWDAGCAPRGLAQPESLWGSATNPDTFDYPIRYFRIEGSNFPPAVEIVPLPASHPFAVAVCWQQHAAFRRIWTVAVTLCDMAID